MPRAGGYCVNPESLDDRNEFRKACKTMTGVAKATVIQCINVVGSVVCGHSGAPWQCSSFVTMSCGGLYNSGHPGALSAQTCWHLMKRAVTHIKNNQFMLTYVLQ